jgi:hypothetical protein
MMRIKILVFCLGFAVFAVMTPPVFALLPEDLVGPEQAAELARGDFVTLAQHTDPRPRLTPRNALVEGLLNEALAALEPGFLVESLFLYPKPPGAAPGSWSEAERTALYNEVTAISTLAGIQYFSTSRGAMRTFYETSSVIDGPEGNPRPDPVVTRPPAESVLYVRQKDLSFGDNIYKYTYYARPEILFCVLENTTTMKIGIIPGVGKHNLRSLVSIYDAGDYLLFYGVSMAKAVSLPGMNQRVGASFSTRAEAILHWLSGQADKAFRKVLSGE